MTEYMYERMVSWIWIVCIRLDKRMVIYIYKSEKAEGQRHEKRTLWSTNKKTAFSVWLEWTSRKPHQQQTTTNTTATTNIAFTFLSRGNSALIFQRKTCTAEESYPAYKMIPNVGEMSAQFRQVNVPPMQSPLEFKHARTALMGFNTYSCKLKVVTYPQCQVASLCRSR